MSPQDWGYFTVAAEERGEPAAPPPSRQGAGRARTPSTPRSGCAGASRTSLTGSGSAPRSGGGTTSAPVYDRIEAYDGPVTTGRGTDGLLDVTVAWNLDPIQQSILDASVEAGLELNPDYNSGHLDGVARMQFNIRGTERWNTYKAYAEAGPWPGQLPGRHRSSGEPPHHRGRSGSVGVEMDVEGVSTEAYAAETILCAGALDSPRVLLRSGVGPADELRALGVDVVLDLPGVGRNLHDHLLSPVVFETTPARWGRRRRGWPRRRPTTSGAVAPGLDSPDTQPINFSVPMYSEEWMSGPEFGFSLMAGLVRPESRGAVTLTGPGSRRPDRDRPQRLRRRAGSRRARRLRAQVSRDRPAARPGHRVGCPRALPRPRPGVGRGAAGLRPPYGDHLPPPGRHVRHGRRTRGGGGPGHAPRPRASRACGWPTPRSSPASPAATPTPPPAWSGSARLTSSWPNRA